MVKGRWNLQGFIFLLVALILFVAFSVARADETGTIEGVVVSFPSFELFTDLDGKLPFPNAVAPGEYVELEVLDPETGSGW